MGRHRLGAEPDEYPGAKGLAPRRSRDSQLPNLSGAASDPRRSVRDLWRQERLCGRRSAVSSGSQHGDGMEECQPTQRNDAIAATRRSLGLATIVPLDEGQQTDRTTAGVPVACGLQLAWQLATDRTAELPAGHRG